MRFQALLIPTVLTLACGGNPVATEEPGPPTSLRVTPASSSLVYLDETRQLQAQLFDADGQVVPDVPITWASDDPQIVSVDADGRATAVGAGSTTIRAAGAGLSGIAQVTVRGESDMTFLRRRWGGEAVHHAPGNEQTLPVVAEGTSEVAGAATRLALSVGSGAEAREIVLLAGTKAALGAWVVAVADGYRGTFATVQGNFGEGIASFSSLARLGGGMQERLILSEFRQTSFLMRIEVSGDDGASWTPVWTIRLSEGTEALPEPSTSMACEAPEYSQFDFWLGQWGVTVPSGGSAGSNRIEPVASACGIQENYRDGGGNTGISLNMYDPRSEEWTQIYMASQGGVLELAGILEGDDMVLSGFRTPAGNVLDRVTWTPRADGAVRQHWETNTQGAGWITFFDGLYTRTPGGSP